MKTPTITAKQIAEVDDLMINTYGITILQMMEHDGIALTILGQKILGNLKNKKITIAYGSGGNGGGALAAARLLYIKGAKITLVSYAVPSKLKSATRYQLAICRNLSIEHKKIEPETFNNADLIIDGLLGYNIKGEPRCEVALLITLINNSKVKILSNDLPSGMDPDVGKIYNPTIKANYTLTIALPKLGLIMPSAKKFKGELYLADIGIPNQVYDEIGIKVKDIFHNHKIIKI